MGVDTKGFFPYATIEKLVSILELITDSDVNVLSTHDEDYKIIKFNYHGEERDLSVFNRIINVQKSREINRFLEKNRNAKYTPEMSIYADSESSVQMGLPDVTPGLYVTFRLWGHSIEIIKILATVFNGYIDENDSDAENFYYIKSKAKEINNRLVSAIFKYS